MTPIFFALNFIACQATHVDQTTLPQNTDEAVPQEKKQESPQKTLEEYLNAVCDAIGLCDAISGEGKLCDKICDEICSPISAEEFQEHLKDLRKGCEKV